MNKCKQVIKQTWRTLFGYTPGKLCAACWTTIASLTWIYIGASVTFVHGCQMAFGFSQPLLHAVEVLDEVSVFASFALFLWGLAYAAFHVDKFQISFDR